MSSRAQEGCARYGSATPSGKRGGVRIIYYWWLGGSQFWLFTLYDKDSQDDLTPAQRKTLKQLLDAELNART